MKINVYLPDKIGINAKDHHINFSKLFRYAVLKRLLELELIELKKTRGSVVHKQRATA